MTAPILHVWQPGDLMHSADVNANEAAIAAAAAQAETEAESAVATAGSNAARLTTDEANISTASSTVGALGTRLTADEASLATGLTAEASLTTAEAADASAIGTLGTRLTGDEATLASDTSSLGTIASKQAADEANIAALQAGGGGGGSAARPMVAFDGSSMTILASRQINKVFKVASGVYKIFFASGIAPPADTVIGGNSFPSFGMTSGGWFGALPSGSDSTVPIIAIQRAFVQPWGVDSATGLFTVTVLCTYQAAATSSPTGYDAAMICCNFIW
jgi:hypothetical protein